LEPEEQIAALNEAATQLWTALHREFGSALNIGAMHPFSFEDGGNVAIVEVAKISKAASKNTANIRGLSISIDIERAYDGRLVFCTRIDSIYNSLMQYVIECVPDRISPRDCSGEYLPPPQDIYFNPDFVRSLAQNSYVREDYESESFFGMYGIIGDSFDLDASSAFVSEVLFSLPEFEPMRYPDETTMRTMIDARRGQGEFRRSLERVWDNRYAVLGISIRELLRASHVKSWKDSDNTERPDPNNGILLSAHLDALFDKFMISFDDNGKMIAAERVLKDAKEVIKIPGKLRKIPSSGMRAYLNWHRTKMEKIRAGF
jgi:hypothetical protein